MEKEETLQELAGNFSTRHLLRIARRLSLFPNDSLYSCILKVSLYSFLPTLAKEALMAYLVKHRIIEVSLPPDNLAIETVHQTSGPQDKILKIGNVQCPIATDSNPLLVPTVVFFENQRQIIILQDILKDYVLGEHILLIGNQGVGKNKIVDYFLQRMNLPREYIQLHRDTTVYSLTSSPTIVNGLLVYDDSPLVKAVKYGYILVVDEADKAPTHVTQILKCLVEDGEMVLSDGRRIVSEGHPESSSASIVIHPNFRMFVLANRPGYPFLGNDFYREIGDVFAAHCVDNPDPDSEMSLLKNYGPNVPEKVLAKLIASFTDLRRLVDQGIINYPYSTRELVNVVRHLHSYPGEGLSRALQNVFDFDTEDDIKHILVETMNKNGIPTGMESSFQVQLAAEYELPEEAVIEKWAVAAGRSLVVVPQDLNVRGTWRLEIPAKWEILDQQSGRAAQFSEWLYSFRVLSDGTPTDVILGSDCYLYAVSTSPVNVAIVSPDHRKHKVVHLYEYIPASRATKLSLLEAGVGKIAIHNSQDHSFICIDIQKSLISTILTAGLDPVYESYLGKGMVDGYHVVYQPRTGAIVFVNFTLLKQFFVLSKLAVHAVFAFEGQWLLQESEGAGGRKHLLRLDHSDGQSVVSFLPLDVSDCYKQAPSMISFLDGRMQHAAPPDLHGAVVRRNESRYTVTGWPRHYRDPCINKFKNVRSCVGFLQKTSQFVTICPYPDLGASQAWLEIVDPAAKRLRRLLIPLALPHGAQMEGANPAGPESPTSDALAAAIKIVELPGGELLFMALSGECRVYQPNKSLVDEELAKWKELTGAVDSGTLKIIYDGLPHPNAELAEAAMSAEQGLAGEGSGKGSGQASESGEASDQDGEGSSGSLTRLGGVGSGAGGPGRGYSDEARESKAIDSSFVLREAGEISKQVSDAQKELHHSRLSQRLKQLQMTEKDYARFSEYRTNVQKEIRELRAVLEAVEAKNKERIWLRNQTSGDIDDTRLVEGLAGERSIYRLRGENDDTFQQKPKRMFFVFDLSASMMRFNGHDGRMDRSIECALMLMEAFKGFEYKFSYHLYGHSGDGPAIDLMPKNVFPKNEKEIFEILTRMQTHAAYTMSGDNTLAGVTTAVQSITKEEGDDYFVLVLSDANLHQYNISPEVIQTGAFWGSDRQRCKRTPESMPL
ncbi:von Willebrand factor A domain-containing protein 8 [Kappamyces sp. JEL0680]|nr:von Willebrand factor A domain-containing protein 8 [Kappamyces sp. JEL0680]